MLRQSTEDQGAENRRCQKSSVSIAAILLRIDFLTYAKLIQWISDCAMGIKVHFSTRYYARSYFDKVLYQGSDIGESNLVPLAISCLSLAIKFNENEETKARLTPQVIFQMAQLIYSREFYSSLEGEIMKAIKFRFRFTTPYDYIDIFYAKFPWDISFKNALAHILNLTTALPVSASYSSEQLFFGTVETILRAKNIQLSSIQKQVLNNMTDTWNKAYQLSNLILKEIAQFL